MLEALLDAARRGHGGVALVGGEAGIGKTRLAQALLETAGGDVACGLGTCVASGSPPWWVWRRALADAARSKPTEPALDRALDAVSSASVAGAAVGDFGDPRLDQFERMRSALLALDRPLLLVLDDLHWADVATLDLLAHLQPDLARTPALIVGTYRVEDVPSDHRLRPLLDRRAGDVHVLTLSGLPAPALPELVASFGVDPDAALVESDELFAATAGNPLFVRELVRLGSAAEGTVPDTVRAVIDERLRRRSDQSRELLEAAAVGGHCVALDLLADVVDLPVTTVLRAAGEWQRDGLLAPSIDQPGSWDFSHALIRQSALALLSPDRRAQLHHRWATILEPLLGVRAPAAVVFDHYRRAAPLARASELGRAARAAGEDALAALAYDDAARLLAEADAAIGPSLPPAERAELLLSLGRAELRVGRRDDAATSFERAAAAARDAGRADQLALAALGLGAGPSGFEIVPFEDRHVELLEDALAGLPSGDSPLRARLLARLSVAKAFLVPAAERRVMAEEAVALARRCEDPATLAYALGALCDAIAGPADVERRLELASEMVALSSRSRDRETELLARRLRVVAHLERGDSGSFDGEVEAYARVADRLRLPLYGWYVPLWRATRAMMRGDFDTAEALQAEATTLGREAASYNAGILGDVATADRLFLSGRLDEADPAHHAIFGRHPELAKLPGLGPVIGTYAAILGHLDEARRLCRVYGVVSLDEIEVDAEWLCSIAYTGVVAALLDETELAEDAYRRLVPHADRFLVDGIGAAFLGSCHGWLAPIAEHLGLAEAAADHRRRAVDANRRAGAVVLAELVERHGRPWAPPAGGGESRAVAVEAPPSGPNVLAWRGDHWHVAYDGVAALLKDTKGLRDLAVLCVRPGAEIPALDLMGAGGQRSGVGSAGEVLDERARREYRDRIIELQAEVDDAEAAGDLARHDRARAELDVLLAELAAATGLGGRARQTGSDAERARKAVSGRIAETLRRLERQHPALARHLRHAVRTGTYCSYQPEHPVSWQVQLPPH